MFNKSYQDRATRQGRGERAVREAGGGHQVAADAALRLPWAGIFEPGFSEPWRPFALTALAAHEGPALEKPAAGPNSDSPAFRRRGRKPPRVLPGQMDLFPLAEMMPEAYETIEVR